MKPSPQSRQKYRWYSRSFFRLLCCNPFLSPLRASTLSRQPLIGFLSLWSSQHFLEFYMNGIILSCISQFCCRFAGYLLFTSLQDNLGHSLEVPALGSILSRKKIKPEYSSWTQKFVKENQRGDKENQRDLSTLLSSFIEKDKLLACISIEMLILPDSSQIFPQFPGKWKTIKMRL